MDGHCESTLECTRRRSACPCHLEARVKALSGLVRDVARPIRRKSPFNNEGRLRDLQKRALELCRRVGLEPLPELDIGT